VGFFHQVARRLLALAGVGHGMRVLDVACGAGAVLVQGARLVGPGGLTVGVDLAEPMAAVAAGQLRRLDQGRGVVAVMDAERLALRAGWFDLVCCASAIYLLDARPRPSVAGRGCCALAGSWRSRSSATWTPAGPGRTSCWSALGRRWNRWAVGTWMLRSCSSCCGRLGAGMVQVRVERLDVVYADAKTWWAQQWAHGERRPLERMDARARGAYQAAAFAAIEACREADGLLHWRPEAIYAVVST
jgi:SAM-dependent methyltransferase